MSTIPRRLRLLPFLVALAIGACSPGSGGPAGSTGPSGAPGSAPPASTAGPAATAGATPNETPAPSAGAVFETVAIMADGQYRLPISLFDRTGLVESIEAVSANAVFEEGIASADAGETLTYTWVGGACDERTLLTFERTETGFRLLSRTETTGDMCIMIGLMRQIAIHLSEPVDAGTVTVEAGQP